MASLLIVLRYSEMSLQPLGIFMKRFTLRMDFAAFHARRSDSPIHEFHSFRCILLQSVQMPSFHHQQLPHLASRCQKENRYEGNQLPALSFPKSVSLYFCSFLSWEQTSKIHLQDIKMDKYTLGKIIVILLFPSLSLTKVVTH